MQHLNSEPSQSWIRRRWVMLLAALFVLATSNATTTFVDFVTLCEGDGCTGADIRFQTDIPTGDDLGAEAGFSLDMGYLNGDRFEDLVIGAPGEGAVYVFFGGVDRSLPTDQGDDWVEEASDDRSVDLAAADLKIVSGEEGSQFGFSVHVAEVGAPCNCCTGGSGLGCDCGECEQSVCAVMPECCVIGWDASCDLQAEAEEDCGCCDDGGFEPCDGVPRSNPLVVGAPAMGSDLLGRAYLIPVGTFTAPEPAPLQDVSTIPGAVTMEGQNYCDHDELEPEPDPEIPCTLDTDCGDGRQCLQDSTGYSVAIGSPITDGGHDVVVGARTAKYGRGRVYVVPESVWTADPDGTIDLPDDGGVYEITGQPGDGLGEYLAVGELSDGDETDEIAVGAVGVETYDEDNIPGRVYIIDDASGDIDLESGGVNLFEGTEVDDFFGFTLTLGDFDGDGANDLVVGAIYADQPAEACDQPEAPEEPNAGAFYFLENSVLISSTLPVPAYASEEGKEFFGFRPWDQLGFGLATGDYDADGIDDLFASARMHDRDQTEYNEIDEGVVYVIRGGFDSVFSSADEDEFCLDCTDNVCDTIPGAVDALVAGGDYHIPTQSEEELGFSLAVGDFNGNARFDDVAASSIRHERVYLVSLAETDAVTEEAGQELDALRDIRDQDDDGDGYLDNEEDFRQDGLIAALDYDGEVNNCCDDPACTDGPDCDSSPLVANTDLGVSVSVSESDVPCDVEEVTVTVLVTNFSRRLTVDDPRVWISSPGIGSAFEYIPGTTYILRAGQTPVLVDEGGDTDPLTAFQFDDGFRSLTEDGTPRPPGDPLEPTLEGTVPDPTIADLQTIAVEFKLRPNLKITPPASPLYIDAEVEPLGNELPHRHGTRVCKLDWTTWCTDDLDCVSGQGDACISLSRSNQTETTLRLLLPDVSVSKSAEDTDGDFLKPGDTIHYEITITNAGDADYEAGGITVYDTFDGNTTLVPGSTAILPPDTGTVTETATDITVSLDDPLQPGDSAIVEFDVTVDAGTPDLTDIPNQAQVELTCIEDVYSDPDEATLTVMIPVLTVLKETFDPAGSCTCCDVDFLGACDDLTCEADVCAADPDCCNVAWDDDCDALAQALCDCCNFPENDDEVEYLITITNTGSAPATQVVAADQIPAGTTYVAASAEVIPAGATPPDVSGDPAVLTASVGDIGNLGSAPNNVATVRFRAGVDLGTADGFLLLNQATVSTYEIPDELSNQTSDAVEAPVLEVSKESSDETGGPPLLVNDTLEYTITIFNSGNAPATDVFVADDIPDELSLVSCTADADWTANDPPCIDVDPGIEAEVDVGTVGPGHTVTITLVTTVDKNTADQTLLENQALVTSHQLADILTVPTSDTVFAPTLGVTKSRDPVGDVLVDDVIDYTIEITNTGSADATNVDVFDEIPANTSYVPGSVSGGGAVYVPAPPPSIEADDLTIAPLATVTITFSVTVDNGTPNGTVISNSATVTSDEVDDIVTDPVTNTVSAPELTVEKVATPNPALAGDPTLLEFGDQIEYRITVTNGAGGSTAENVTITDLLPVWVQYAGVTGASDVLEASVTVTGTPGIDQSIEADAGDVVSPGSVSLIFLVDVRSGTPNGTSVVNQATVDTDEVAGLATGTTDDTVSAPVLSAPKTASLVDRVGDPTALEIGDRLAYTISIRNDGPADATGVVLTDTLPDHTELVAGSATTDQGVITTSGPDELIVDIGTIAAMAMGDPSIVVAFQVEILGTAPAVPNNIINLATLESDQLNPLVVIRPDTADVPFNFTKTSTPDPAIAGDPFLLEPGDQIEYSITFDHLATDLTVVTLSDLIPADTQYVPASLVADVAWTHDATALPGEIRLTRALLDVDDTVTFRVEILGTATPGDIENFATLFADELDDTGTNGVKSNTTADEVVVTLPLVPFEPRFTGIDGDSLGWEDVAGAVSYHLYRSGAVAEKFCWLAASEHTDTYQPAAGEVAFYLVTADNGFAESGLGEDSAGNPRPNADPCR
jgi:uncharacterized repeat protein (TIGR01451 family)